MFADDFDECWSDFVNKGFREITRLHHKKPPKEERLLTLWEEKNKREDKQNHTRGPSGKTVVVGMKDREANKVVAKPVPERSKENDTWTHRQECIPRGEGLH